MGKSLHLLAASFLRRFRFNAYPLGDVDCSQPAYFFEVALNLGPAAVSYAPNFACLDFDEFTPDPYEDRVYQQNLITDESIDSVVSPLNPETEHLVQAFYSSPSCEPDALLAVQGLIVDTCIQINSKGYPTSFAMAMCEILKPPTSAAEPVGYGYGIPPFPQAAQKMCTIRYFRDSSCSDVATFNQTLPSDQCVPSAIAPGLFLKPETLFTTPDGTFSPTLNEKYTLATSYRVIEKRQYASKRDESLVSFQGAPFATGFAPIGFPPMEPLKPNEEDEIVAIGRTVRLGRCQEFDGQTTAFEPVTKLGSANLAVNKKILNEKQCKSRNTFPSLQELNKALKNHIPPEKTWLRHRVFFGSGCSPAQLWTEQLIRYDVLAQRSEYSPCLDLDLAFWSQQIRWHLNGTDIVGSIFEFDEVERCNPLYSADSVQVPVEQLSLCLETTNGWSFTAEIVSNEKSCTDYVINLAAKVYDV
jgi:hypothetical protein